MIFEAILETVVPAIRKISGYIFFEILIQTSQTICYATGFAVARLVTFGKSPKTFISPKYVPRKYTSQQQGWVVVIGILFWCVVLFFGVFIFLT